MEMSDRWCYVMLIRDRSIGSCHVGSVVFGWCVWVCGGVWVCGCGCVCVWVRVWVWVWVRVCVRVCLWVWVWVRVWVCVGVGA